jgi:aminopeptidase N
MADDRNAPATKGDIEDLREDLRGEMKEQIGTIRSEMQESAAMLRSEMQHMHDDFLEQARHAETRLLQAFYAFAQSSQERLTLAERDAAGLKDRMALYEQRLIDLERKVNFPDHPPQT